ncbi:hypothetical protein HF996_00400 [Mycoplasma sp. 1654_15]|nr:hypothetical protein HF996_00400 [Mycoplasma sp. 1654_15]
MFSEVYSFNYTYMESCFKLTTNNDFIFYLKNTQTPQLNKSYKMIATVEFNKLKINEEKRRILEENNFILFEENEENISFETPFGSLNVFEFNIERLTYKNVLKFLILSIENKVKYIKKFVDIIES